MSSQYEFMFGNRTSDIRGRGLASEHDSVLHSWCVQSQWQAPTVVGGSGAHLQLADGRRILDMSSLAECSNLGHQHPAIIEAIRARPNSCASSPRPGARNHARSWPKRSWRRPASNGGRVFFTLAGADANENAVKFARQASGKPHGSIVTRDRSYHGASYACMALSGDARTRAQVDPASFGVLHVPPPYAYRCRVRQPRCDRPAASARWQP